MKRRRVIMLLLGLIVTGVVAVIVWPGEREPEYQGRKLGEWLVIYSASKGEWETGEAMERREAKAVDAIRHIGTNAIPLLLKWIRYDTPSWRYRLDSGIQNLPSIIGRNAAVESLTEDRAKARADMATVAFEILGPTASVAIPELTRLLNDSQVRQGASRAACALCGVGREGVALVCARLDSNDREVRRQAIFAIGLSGLGTNAITAVPGLIRALDTDDDFGAVWAAELLGNLTLESDIVVRSLVRCAQRTDLPAPGGVTGGTWIDRRYAAVIALGQFGGEARSVVPWLREVAGTTNHYLYRAATNSLHKIAPEFFGNTNATGATPKYEEQNH